VVAFPLNTTSEVPDHYREADPIELPMSQAKQWLIHGSADDVVPPEFSRDYVAAKQKRAGRDKEDAHLIMVAGADHFDLIDPRSKAWKWVEQTVMKLAE
jgi:pimeloyl-ACP methyl ester carboxylesterase